MRAIDRKKPKAALFVLAVTVVAVMFALNSCNSQVLDLDAAEDPRDVHIILGVVDGERNRVVAEIYAGALKRAGYDVGFHSGFTGQGDYAEALEDGKIDAALAYAGDMLLSLDSTSADSESVRQVSIDDVVAALEAAVPAELEVLKPSRADDKEVLVTTAALAERYKLRSTEGMVKICKELISGMSAEPATGTSRGLSVLEKKNGCRFKEIRRFPASDGTMLVRALQTQEVQIINTFSSNPAIADNSFVVLEDSYDGFAAQNIVPLVHREKVGKKAQSIWNEVSSKLDMDSLVFLNREMIGNAKKTPAQAAEKWLDENGFKLKEDGS